MSALTVHPEDVAACLKSCVDGFDSIQAIAKAIQEGTADHVSLARAIDYIAGDLMEAVGTLSDELQQPAGTA